MSGGRNQNAEREIQRAVVDNDGVRIGGYRFYMLCDFNFTGPQWNFLMDRMSSDAKNLTQPQQYEMMRNSLPVVLNGGRIVGNEHDPEDERDQEVIRRRHNEQNQPRMPPSEGSVGRRETRYSRTEQERRRTRERKGHILGFVEASHRNALRSFFAIQWLSPHATVSVIPPAYRNYNKKPLGIVNGLYLTAEFLKQLSAAIQDGKLAHLIAIFEEEEQIKDVHQTFFYKKNFLIGPNRDMFLSTLPLPEDTNIRDLSKLKDYFGDRKICYIYPHWDCLSLNWWSIILSEFTNQDIQFNGEQRIDKDSFCNEDEFDSPRWLEERLTGTLTAAEDVAGEAQPQIQQEAHRLGQQNRQNNTHRIELGNATIDNEQLQNAANDQQVRQDAQQPDPNMNNQINQEREIPEGQQPLPIGS